MITGHIPNRSPEDSRANAKNWEFLDDWMNRLHPWAFVGKAAPQGIATGGAVKIWDMDTIFEERGTRESQVDLPNNRLICRLPGVYHVDVWWIWAVDGVGYRYGDIFINNSFSRGSRRKGAVDAGGSDDGISRLVRLAAGDFVEFRFFHNSTTTPLTVSAEANWYWLGP